MGDGNQFAKLASVPASPNGGQTTTIYRDLHGAHLRASTTYTFKVLALQFGAACEELSSNDLESDVLSASTTAALVPSPPSRPSLLYVEGCSVSIAVIPPEDFNGAVVSGYTVRISTAAGLHRTVVVDAAASSTLTVRSLVPFSNYSATASIVCDVGTTEYGELLWFSTDAPRAPSKLPLLNVTDIGSSSAVVAWNAPEDTGGGVLAGMSSIVTSTRGG